MHRLALRLLGLAAESGHLAIVDELLRHGGSDFRRDTLGSLACDGRYACSWCRCDTAVRCPRGRTMLQPAAPTRPPIWSTLAASGVVGQPGRCPAAADMRATTRTPPRSPARPTTTSRRAA